MCLSDFNRAGPVVNTTLDLYKAMETFEDKRLVLVDKSSAWAGGTGGQIDSRHATTGGWND